MNATDGSRPGESASVDELVSAAVRVAFGSYTGATVFFGALVWFGLYWRLGFFSNDQYTFANALVGILDGHLFIDSPTYGPETGATPGTHLVDGRVYGRNYGILFASAVWLAVLRSLSLVADVRVIVVAVWSLSILGLGASLGRALDRRRAGAAAGTVLAVTLFAGNLAVATPLEASRLPLVALQATTALCAALAAVALYRLCARVYSERVGIFAGVVAVVGTPVGFWATLPKRHSATVLFVILSMYTLYRSRDAGTVASARRFRAITYCWPGLAAWVHAPEGFVLLVAVGTVDLATARSNRPVDLLLIGSALFASLIPFFLTNAAISGDLLRPPRLLPTFTGEIGATGSSSADPFTGGGAVDTSGGDGRSRGWDRWVPGVVPVLLSRFAASYNVLFADFGRTFQIFVRTGYVPSMASSQDAAINLSVLASMPLLGVLIQAPLLAARAGKTRFAGTVDRNGRTLSPARVVDAFTVLYVVCLLGLYLTSLPLHHMFTVRYLSPIYPVGVYWLVRLPSVRRAVNEHGRSVVNAFVGTLCTGFLGYVGAIALAKMTIGEGVQFYALAALLVAGSVVVWSVVDLATESHSRAGAILLGIGVGIVSVYLLVSGLSLFPVTGEFLLPVGRVLSEHVHVSRLVGNVPPH